MKRLTGRSSKEAALARKRVLIRALIEQAGLASAPGPEGRSENAGERRTSVSNIILFPTLGK